MIATALLFLHMLKRALPAISAPGMMSPEAMCVFPHAVTARMLVVPRHWHQLDNHR